MEKKGTGNRAIIIIVLILIILLLVVFATKIIKTNQETNTIKNEIVNQTNNVKNMVEPDSSTETERRS